MFESPITIDVLTRGSQCNHLSARSTSQLDKYQVRSSLVVRWTAIILENQGSSPSRDQPT